MASVTVTVQGLPELEAKLIGFEAKVRPGLLATTRPGAKMLVAAIKAEAPVGDYTPAQAAQRVKQGDVSGNLQRSVQYKASKTRRSGFTGHVVAPYGRGSAHRYLVLAGHRIRGQFQLRVGSVRALRRQYARSGEMTTPDPFVQRGREKAEAAALAAAEVAAAKVIEAAAKL